MDFLKKPNQLQICSAVVVKMAVMTISFLCFSIYERVHGLIAAHEEKSAHNVFFPWLCVLVSGMCLLVVINWSLIGGIVFQRAILLRIWIFTHYLVLIGLLHLIIVYLWVRKMYEDCLITLMCTLWTVIFIWIVQKCAQYMEQQQKSNDVALLANDFNGDQ